jgi:hypothetical protein
MSRPRAHIPVTTLRVADVSELIGRRRRVIIAKTGRAVWLPASEIQLHSGRVTIPDWLAARGLTRDGLTGD